MAKSANLVKNLRKLKKVPPEKLIEMNEIERRAIAGFKGMFGELETALGMLRIGHHTGWKALVIIHDKKTIKKYEEILDINIREFFPEEGPLAERSAGYGIAKKLSNFWKAVSGDVPVAKRRVIDE